jgi:hypothetical protein
MALPLIKNMVGMTVTSVASAGLGTITLNAADTGYRSFATAYGANANVDIRIEEGTAWEIARDCTYTNSGTTVTRGTFGDSSTGSAVAFTSAAKVYVIDDANRLNTSNAASAGAISGFEMSYSSTTAFVIAAGRCAINGVMQTLAGATLTSGSTMKNLNNATVTLGASKGYHVYAWNNAGTMQFAVQDWSDATYGGTPTYDADNDYYKAAYATVGTAARRIGKILTNASSQISVFYQVTAGRVRSTHFNVADFTILSSGASATYASIGTLTPFITSDESEVFFVTPISPTGTGVTASAVLSENSGTWGTFIARWYTGSTLAHYFGLMWRTNTGNFQYLVSNSTLTIVLGGIREVI